jgi:hypothetical protein
LPSGDSGSFEDCRSLRSGLHEPDACRCSRFRPGRGAAVLDQVPQSQGVEGQYVTGGVALAEEYSAFVVGEFDATSALYAGEGRLLPLHGQRGGLSEFLGDVVDELPGLRFAQ